MSRFPSQAERRTARRSVLGLLLLVCFVFGQAYVAMHHALVEHHVCAAGGELVHGGHGHGSDGIHHDESEHHQPGEPGEPEGPFVAPSDHEAEHGEQCSIPTTRGPRRWLPVTPPSQSIRLKVALRGVASGPQRAVRGQEPVYRLAPKQSPPRI